MPVDTEPTLAEIDAASVFTVDGHSGAEGVDHVIAAVKAIHHADGAKECGESRNSRIHRLEMEALRALQEEARSPELALLIGKGIEAREASESAWKPFGEAQEAYRDLRVAGATTEELKQADDVENSLEEVWQAARRKAEGIGYEVAQAPFTCMADALVRGKAAGLLIGANENPECIPETDEDVLVVLRSYRDALIQLSTSAPECAKWNEAMRAWQEARARYEGASAAYDEYWDKARDSAPDWLKETNSRGVVMLRAETLASFDSLPASIVRTRRSDFIAWRVHAAPLLERRDAEAKRCDVTYDALCDAERALIMTPAPHLEAVAFKAWLLGIESDDDKKGYDDPAFLSARLDMSYIKESWPAWIYLDCARLAERPEPARAAPGFSPRKWVSKFPGKVKAGLDGEVVIPTMPPVTDEITDLMSELATPGARATLARYLAEMS